MSTIPSNLDALADFQNLLDLTISFRKSANLRFFSRKSAETQFMSRRSRKTRQNKFISNSLPRAQDDGVFGAPDHHWRGHLRGP
jgi:hypothetical protein